MAGRPSRNTARLATILDHLPDAVLLVDPSGEVVNANARALELLRAPGAPRPLLGRVIVDVLPGFGLAADKPSRRHGAPAPRETQRMTAQALDGSTFPVEVFRALVPWAGSEDHLLLVLHEAADTMIESELLRASQQAQAILRATEEAICGVDRNGKVVLANPAAARLLGARVGDVAGKDLHGLALHTRLDGSPYPAEETSVGQALASGKHSPRRREVFWRADGSPVPVDITSVAIKEGADVVGAVAAITDVTRGVEDERRRHRLIQILDSELAPALAALLDSDLADPTALAAELARLRAIAADAVDYERLMGGQVTLKTTSTDVGEVVRESVDSIAAAARERQVTVDVLIEPCFVAADFRRLTLAVGELVRAAVYSSAAGASVAVSTGLVADRVRIGVRETRVADISQENPLLRWLRPGRDRQQGPDPDLAYVQIVVERHGGRFLLEPSSSGARSYVLELPTVEAEAAPADPTGDAAHREQVRDGAETERAMAEVVSLRAEPEATVTELPRPVPASAVIPLPARSPLRAVDAVAAPVAGVAEAAVVEALPSGAVLVWPSAGAGLAVALAERGAPPAGVFRLQHLTDDATSAATVLLVDPLAGPVSRRMLGELRAAAASAALPLIVAAGLTEAPAAEAGLVIEPPVLLAALRGPTATGAARVLIIEPDPALATALGASLLKSGMQAVYARNSDEAMMRAALGAPDMVMFGMDAEDGRAGIVDWLVNAKLLAATPLLTYTLEGMTPGYATRLERGTSVVGVGARSESPEIEARLADLVAQIGAASTL